VRGFKEISKFRSHFTYLESSFIIAKNGHDLSHLSRGCVALFLRTFFVIMAGYLRCYDYEPEYTTEELDELSGAAVTTSMLHLKTCIEFRKHNHR